MDRTVNSHRSPSDHEIPGAEQIEDIIDVENEMGFGEGEGWAFDGKPFKLKPGPLKSSVGYIRSRSNSPLRRPPAKGNARWHPQKPSSHGLKHVVSPLPSDEDSNPNTAGLLQRREEHDASSTDDVVEHDTEKIGKHIVRHTGGGSEGGSKQIKKQQLCSPQDQEMGTDAANSIDTPPQPKDYGVDNRCRDQLPDVAKRGSTKTGRSKQGGVREVAHVNRGHGPRGEPKLRTETRQERNSNRVRFSLDIETAEKLMGGGVGASKGIKADKGADCEQENTSQIADATPIERSREKGLTVKGRVVNAPRRKELAERRDMIFDLEKAIEMREDKKAIRLAQERIERLEDALLRQQEIAANMRVSLAQDGLKDSGKLRMLLDALEKNIRKLTILRSRHYSDSFQLKTRADQVERLKAHCNMLETDRERLKKNLEHLLESTRAKEKEVDDLRAERDRLLELQKKGPDNSLEKWESKLKQVEASFAAEKGVWETHLNAAQCESKDKEQEWVTKLKEKEFELCRFRTSQARLVESLVSCQQGLDELKQVVAAQTEGKCINRRAEQGFLLRSMTQHQFPSSPGRCCEENDALELARSISTDIGSLRKLLEESPLVVQRELKPPFDDGPREEVKVIEERVSRALNLTDACARQMERSEDNIRMANETCGRIVTEEEAEVDALEKQLAETGQGVDALVMSGLRNEVSLLDKEQSQGSWRRLSHSAGDATPPELMEGVQKRAQELWEKDTLAPNLTDAFAQQRERRDDEIRMVNEPHGHIVAESKGTKVDASEKQLAEKEQGVDALVGELRNEPSLLDKESAKEQSQASRLSHSERGLRLPELLNGVQKTEQQWWEKEMEVLKGKLDEMTSAVALKDGRIGLLEEEVHAKADQLTKEKQKWDMAIKEVKQQAAKTVLGFVNDKENGLLQYLKKHKTGGRKASQVQKAGLAACQVDETTWELELSRKKEKASPQDCCAEDDVYPTSVTRAGRNRAMEKQDILDILEKNKGSGSNTFTLLQSTVKDMD